MICDNLHNPPTSFKIIIYLVYGIKVIYLNMSKEEKMKSYATMVVRYTCYIFETMSFKYAQTSL